MVDLLVGVGPNTTIGVLGVAIGVVVVVIVVVVVVVVVAVVVVVGGGVVVVVVAVVVVGGVGFFGGVRGVGVVRLRGVVGGLLRFHLRFCLPFSLLLWSHLLLS